MQEEGFQEAFALVVRFSERLEYEVKGLSLMEPDDN